MVLLVQRLSIFVFALESQYVLSGEHAKTLNETYNAQLQKIQNDVKDLKDNSDQLKGAKGDPGQKGSKGPTGRDGYNGRVGLPGNPGIWNMIPTTFKNKLIIIDDIYYFNIVNLSFVYILIAKR